MILLFILVDVKLWYFWWLVHQDYSLRFSGVTYFVKPLFLFMTYSFYFVSINNFYLVISKSGLKISPCSISCRRSENMWFFTTMAHCVLHDNATTIRTTVELQCAQCVRFWFLSISIKFIPIFKVWQKVNVGSNEIFILSWKSISPWICAVVN